MQNSGASRREIAHAHRHRAGLDTGVGEVHLTLYDAKPCNDGSQ